MQTKNPVKGLLVYSFHSAKGNVTSALLLGLVLGAALLATGNNLVHSLFGWVAIAGPAYVAIVGMGGKTGGKWERFQLTMPLRRSDVAKSQYLLVFLASTVGIPLFIIITGINSVLHGDLFDFTITSIVTNISPLLSMPLVMAGLLFPLACTRIGEENQEGLAFFCLIAATACITFLLPWAGQKLSLSNNVTPLLIVAISVIAYMVSYLATRKLYTKMDF